MFSVKAVANLSVDHKRNLERKPHKEDKAIDYVIGVLDIPWRYYAIAVILAVVVGWKWRWESGFFTGYLFLLIAETILIRKPFIGEHLKLEPLWSWRAWSVQKEQILTNIVMFIPVGVFSGLLWRWKGLLITVGVSVAIELLQLLSGRGLCEFDDVFHNMLGAIIGICLVVAENGMTGDHRVERDMVEK